MPVLSFGSLGLLDAIRRAQTTFQAARAHPLPRLDPDGQRILLVYLFPRLGDTLLFLPAVAALLRHAPEAEVELLVAPLAARVVKTVELPVKVHVLGPETDEATLEAALRRRRFDYALDLTHRGDVDARSWLLRSGAEHRAGFVDAGEDPAALGFLYGVRDDRVETHTHWSRFCVEPLRAFGVESPDFELRFRLSETDRTRARGLFGEGPRLLVVPGGQDPKKCWPPERFAAIGRAFLERHQGSVVVTGAPWEAELVKSVARAIGPAARSFTGKSLVRLTALVDACDVLVGNDTGPVHYGFFMQKRVLSIFSRMSPEVWGPPFADPHFSVLRAYDSAAPEDDERWSALAIDRLDALMQTGP